MEVIAGLLAPQLIPVLTEGITQLIKYLAEVRAIKKHNKLIQEEITNFSERLRSNLELVRTKLPERVSGVALDTLVKDLQKANEYMQQSLAEGKFKTFWSAKETRACLEALRQKLMASFQMAFLVTTLDVALEGHRSTENFQGVMVGLFHSQKSDSAAAQASHLAELRGLFKPLVWGQDQQMQRQDQHMQKQEQMMKMVDDMRATLNQIASQQEDGISEKFLNDVITAINQSLSNSPGESSGSGSGSADNEEFKEANTYTEELDDLRAKIKQLEASSSEAKKKASDAAKEAKERIWSLTEELESEKVKNADLSVKFKEELNTAQNQVTKLEEELQVAEKEAEDLLSLSAKLARKGSENAQLIKKLNGKVTALGGMLKALGSQLEEADSS
ncbi:hypothetical protein R1sor_020865 [Riccia sorocarpa]|uniref:Uncharacterized protein n=1 Tax=Riccia sorocarpa TaxID=122646 RepID=A0ABD3GHI7_9MARC